MLVGSLAYAAAGLCSMTDMGLLQNAPAQTAVRSCPEAGEVPSACWGPHRAGRPHLCALVLLAASCGLQVQRPKSSMSSSQINGRELTYLAEDELANMRVTNAHAWVAPVTTAGMQQLSETAAQMATGVAL